MWTKFTMYSDAEIKPICMSSRAKMIFFLVGINLVRCDLNEMNISLLHRTLELVPQITLDGCRMPNGSVDIYDLLLKKCLRLRTLNIIQCNTFDHGTWLRRQYPVLKTVQVST